MKNILYKLKKKLAKISELSNAAKKLTEFEGQDQTFSTILNHLKSFALFNPSQKDSEIKYLYDLVQERKCRIIGEIGTYKGGSLYILTQAAPPNSKMISVDINYPIERKIAHRKFAKKGSKVVCIEGDTKDQRTFNRVEKHLGRQKFDLLFIDGDHSLFGVMNDYVRYSPLVKKSGLIVFHDIQPVNQQESHAIIPEHVGEVPMFWKLLKESGVETTEIIENEDQNGAGLGIIYK